MVTSPMQEGICCSLSSSMSITARCLQMWGNFAIPVLRSPSSVSSRQTQASGCPSLSPAVFHHISMTPGAQYCPQWLFLWEQTHQGHQENQPSAGSHSRH